MTSKSQTTRGQGGCWESESNVAQLSRTVLDCGWRWVRAVDLARVVKGLEGPTWSRGIAGVTGGRTTAVMENRQTHRLGLHSASAVDLLRGHSEPQFTHL